MISPILPDGWFAQEGIAFVIVLPLIMAAVCAVMPRGRISWALTMLVAAACAVVSYDLLARVVSDGVMSYAMGGWDPPLGIELRLDGLNAPLLFLISGMAVVCTLYALRSVQAEIEPKKRAPFYAAFLVTFAGLLGMVATADAFNVFVFLEISSISTYVLVAMGAARDRRALDAAFTYLILGSIGATFFVIGVGFLYMQTGTLNMGDIADKLAAMGGPDRVTQVAYAFIVIGLGLKLAMFPLHAWLPGAYAHAPSYITAFLAATATKAALYLLLRFTFTVFDPSLEFIGAALTWLLAVLGIIGMIVASFQAIFQKDARRVLAFSSVAQVGYILLGIGMATLAGLSAGYIHLINHAVIKGGLFIALGAFWYRFGITRVHDFRGLGKTMPLTMGAFTISALALIGVPFTAGFISKWQLLVAAADKGWWWAVATIVFTSILAVIYMGRMLELAWLKEPPSINGKTVARNEAPLTMLIPMWALAIGAIILGVNSTFSLELAGSAARAMMTGVF